MTSRSEGTLSMPAQRLLRFARMRGEEGLVVAGHMDGLAVEELTARGLVREEAVRNGVSYSGRIWIVDRTEEVIR